MFGAMYSLFISVGHWYSVIVFSLLRCLLSLNVIIGHIALFGNDINDAIDTGSFENLLGCNNDYRFFAYYCDFSLFNVSC